MSEQSGTFVIVHADNGAAEFREAETGQVYTLEDNPGVEAGDVVEATLEPVPPMEVAYRVVDVADQRTVEVSESREPPTGQTESAALDQAPGELTRIERAGEGELHVITVQAGESGEAVADVLDDEAGLLARAARLDVNRVSVRSADEVAGEDGSTVGVVSVRYLP